MNKTVKSAFSFGIFLVSIGLIGHFLKWRQAQILILMGIVFELYAVMVYAWRRIKGKDN